MHEHDAAERPQRSIPASEPQPADLRKQIDTLHAAAEKASAHVQNLYLTFLFVGVYLAIAFASTTPEQLLRESPIKLPLLDVELPLRRFYQIAPLLLVLLHLHLLVQCWVLASKLRPLNDAINKLACEERRMERSRLDPFLFTQILAGHDLRPSLRKTLINITWVTIVLLPALFLLLGQAMFIAYHDPVTTHLHRAFVVIDLLGLLLIWPIAQELRGFHKMGPERINLALWCAFGSTLVLTSFFVLTIPGEPYLSVPLDRTIGERARLGPLARNLDVQDANLIGTWPSQAQIDQMGEALAWEIFGKAINLKGRDLRFGDFSRSVLPRADLRGARLKGAVLRYANLQGADLDGADLEGAHLIAADLRSAVLRDASLRGARLGGANLAGANLQRAHMQGAALRSADLQVAFLRDARLQGATLGHSDLRGADLERADLTGADLREAALWGAEFRETTLSLADLRQLRLAPPAGGIDDWSIAVNALEEYARTPTKERLARLEPALAGRTPWRLPRHVLEAGATPTVDSDRALAQLLAGLACERDAPLGVAQGAALRAAWEQEPGRTYPRLLAKALLDESCISAKAIDPEIVHQLQERLGAGSAATQARSAHMGQQEGRGPIVLARYGAEAPATETSAFPAGSSSACAAWPAGPSTTTAPAGLRASAPLTSHPAAVISRLEQF